MVRWVGCVLAAGLGCTTPNPWFHVSEQPSTGEPGTSAGDPPDPASTGSTTNDPGAGANTTDPPGTTTTSTTTLGAMTSDGGEPATTTTTAGELDTGDPGTTTTGEPDPGPCHDVCGTPGCGECPGGDPMVPFDQFSIDAREVSNAQYQQFLAAELDPGDQGPACAWNDSFTPAVWPVGDGGLPVVNVDWCDARAYCRWAGKRLCGAIAGGPTPLPQAFKPGVDQWHHACTDGGLLPFPYGPVYDPKACNVHDFDPDKDAIMATGALATCMAPVDGLFDLSGNVWELTDTCDGDGPDSKCIRRGGSFFSKAPDLGCYIQSLRPRKDVYAYVGFRCCSP